MENKREHFFIGTSNITLPVANKKEFPEAFKGSSRLTYYASLFNTVEINSTFYKIPRAKTIIRWTEEVPREFRFTFKLNREITHDKERVCNPVVIKNFMQIINNVETQKGCLLVQFPASVHHNPSYLECLLFTINEHNQSWKVCIEFRHPSWYNDTIFQLLSRYGSTLVIHDMFTSILSQEELDTGFVYLRFHGPAGDYRGGYNPDMLDRCSAKIATSILQGKMVFAYFNNTMGNALSDALTLQKLVAARNRKS